jgi:hypothetical protein
MSKTDPNQFQTVEEFCLGRTLGQGTFGKVKEAIHIKTQQKYAVKILEKKKIK